MSEKKVGRRSLIGGGVKGLAVGASAVALSNGIVSSSVAGSNCGKYSLERYQEYLDAFNRDGSGQGGGDFARFYTQDVVYERGQNHTMRGIRPIVDFYAEMYVHVRQEMSLIRFAATENFIASEVESRFSVLKDWKHDSGLFLRKGRKFTNHDFSHYKVTDEGLISHVRFANFRRFNDNKKK